jgi:hypothetical protein
MFVIVAPPYTQSSNGIKTMHKICHTINQVGGDARLLFLNGGIQCGSSEHVNPVLNTPVLKREDLHLVTDKAIVVYPEIVSGNPLCASKVVRYLGNKDGLLTGKPMGAGPNDFLLAHSVVIEPKAHYVLHNAEFNPVFNDSDTESYERRALDATYIGKGFVHGRGFAYGECPIVPKTLWITRNWPQGAEQLAYVLRRTRFFFTYDPWTATNIEAILCGAVPYFLRYEPWTEKELDGSELGIIPRLDEKKHDLAAFLLNRKKLIKRIEELSLTWASRVAEFVSMAERHLN